MSDYRKIYEKYEGTALHTETVETVKAEECVNRILCERVFGTTRHDLDAAIGALARAYEMQGLKMGLSIAKT